MTTGTRIREARKAAGYTGQVGFAKALGTDQPSVSRWETDKHQPSRKWQKRIAKLVGEPDLFAVDGSGGQPHADHAGAPNPLSVGQPAGNPGPVNGKG